jgi:tetratricopeptide (TPR) repeat protein
MQEAMRLLQEGRPADAETLLRRAARDAEELFGRGSHEDAVAHNDLGNLHAHVGDLKRAAAAYRRACSGPLPTETQALRDRLTYLVNLATTLETLGELDEAEEVLRRGVERRREFYGPDHPGHAFGLEPLAALLLRRGKHEEALRLLNEAATIYWNHGHPRVASALAVRAEALKAVGNSEPPFAGCGKLPDPVFTDLVGTVLQRAGKTDPAWARPVLADLLATVEARLGLDHALTLNVLATIANHEADRGERCDHEVRLRAIRRALASLERQGRTAEALHARQGLALALNAAGRDAEARTAYADTLERALRAGERGIASQVRRNYGLYLADRKESAEAERQLRAAADDAEAAEDLERWGRAEGTLGIFLMHQGRAAEARPLLERALHRLDPAHPDTVYARHHLNALSAGQPCHCGDSWEALADQLRAYILRQVPRGLLADLELEFQGQGQDIKVNARLAREASEDELERLQIIINQAIHTFKNQLSRRQ